MDGYVLWGVREGVPCPLHVKLKHVKLTLTLTLTLL